MSGIIFGIEHVPQPKQQRLWQCKAVPPSQRISYLKRVSERQKCDTSHPHFFQYGREEREEPAYSWIFDDKKRFVAKFVDDDFFYLLAVSLRCTRTNPLRIKSSPVMPIGSSRCQQIVMRVRQRSAFPEATRIAGVSWQQSLWPGRPKGTDHARKRGRSAPVHSQDEDGLPRWRR